MRQVPAALLRSSDCWPLRLLLHHHLPGGCADAPHEAQPHNLMGIIMERENDHIRAMKHFRAAWALDPSFVPTRINMERYGSFSFSMPRPAYDEADCEQETNLQHCRIETDERGIGHVVRR